MDSELGQLPHGEGFRFIDRVIACEPGKRGTFECAIAADHPILQAHFPGRPLVPGVILIEALAQAAACVWSAAEPEGPLTTLLARVQGARFRSPVGPDETMTLAVECTHQLGAMRRFSGTVRVGDRLAAEAELTLARKPG
jgi:3-hydroxyacyl-[acyl-carrier-protein] dehydratase